MINVQLQDRAGTDIGAGGGVFLMLIWKSKYRYLYFYNAGGIDTACASSNR